MLQWNSRFSPFDSINFTGVIKCNSTVPFIQTTDVINDWINGHVMFHQCSGILSTKFFVDLLYCPSIEIILICLETVIRVSFRNWSETFRKKVLDYFLIGWRQRSCNKKNLKPKKCFSDELQRWPWCCIVSTQRLPRQPPVVSSALPAMWKWTRWVPFSFTT